MEDALQPKRADLKHDYFEFMEFLSEKAEIFEEVQLLREYLNTKSKSRESSNKNRKESTAGSSQSSRSGGSTSKSDNKSDGAKPRKTLPLCLNPNCSENYCV